MIALLRKLFSYALCLTITFSPLFPREENRSNYLLYLAGSGYLEKAISFLPTFYTTKDYDFLQKLAVLILEDGLKSPKREDQRLTLYGAGVALSTHSLKILEKGLLSLDPPSQLIALHYLGFLQDQKTEYLIKKALSSDFLEVRVEALYQLCLKKDPTALGQMEALRGKLPSVFKPFFPQFLALIGTPEATSRLKHYLTDENPEVRIETILSIGKFKREEMLFYLKKRFKESQPNEKEALLQVLSSLGDTALIYEMEKEIQQGSLPVQISAILALHQLGNKNFDNLLLDKAKTGNLLALSACAFLEESGPLLIKMAKSQNIQIKANAMLALLSKRDAKCLPFLMEILTSDMFLETHFSPGRTLKYIKAFSTSFPEINPEISLSIKEALLKEALELKEDVFLNLAEQLIEKERRELIPVLFKLLENIKTPKAIALLNRTVKNNLPLIRAYAHLTLFRLEEKGLHEIFLMEWLEEESSKAKISLKSFDSVQKRYDASQFELSRDEVSSLFLEIISSFVEKHNPKAPELILKALVKSAKSNRYPLAGMLLRATE